MADVVTLDTRELSNTIGEPLRSSRAIQFSSITADSRRVQPGGLFVALDGEQVDGHDYAEQARANGAVAVLGARDGIEVHDGLPYVHTSNPRYALARIAHALRGDPTQDLIVIGVTGTNGKSSTVFLIQRILETAGIGAAQFGTLGYRIGDCSIDAPHTTPFAEDLAEMFAQARGAGLTHVVMEVSSHAIQQERVASIGFNAGVFTNLTQDHLDYHETMEGYLKEKLKLFERIDGEDAFTVANAEDACGDRFERASTVPCYRFGGDGACRAEQMRLGPRQTEFHLVSPWGEGDIALKLLGRHNVSNTLAAIATCGALGVPLDVIIRGVESVESVPGRFEHIDTGQMFQVVVDYAHTEDGLRNVLNAAREVCDARVIVVFGCGGDRDRGKRPKMAHVAATLADFAIVTSDNPRTESPEVILDEIESGLREAGKSRDQNYLVIEDREEAISRALELAQPDDLVLIAGKGHEDYQIINQERIHFDDREVARTLLEAM